MTKHECENESPITVKIKFTNLPQAPSTTETGDMSAICCSTQYRIIGEEEREKDGGLVLPPKKFSVPHPLESRKSPFVTLDDSWYHH